MSNNKPVRVFSMFTGIGGFEVGLSHSNIEYEMVGFSEIDKYAIQIFEKNFKGVKNYGNATTINESELPDFDLLAGGFPCQAFSMAGKRKGFNDTRGTLFFDIARILAHKKPKHFILENVKGLLSHDNGRTMQTILEVLSDIGYMVQWELLNSKNYGVPQNRERVYIVGHLRGTSRPEVFPIREIFREDNTENKPIEITKDMSQPYRVYDEKGLAVTLKSEGGGVGAKTGLYKVGARFKDGNVILQDTSTCLDANYYKGFDNMGQRTGAVQIKIKEATKKGYATAEEGDSINLTQPNSNTRRGRVGKQIAQTIDTKMEQYTLIKYKYGQKSLNETLEKSNLKDDDIKALDLYNRKAKDICPTLTEPHHNSIRLYERSKIRRLTPIECERLQGFPDGWTEGISDTQRYKCLGNAVTTNVVTEIINRLYSNN